MEDRLKNIKEEWAAEGDISGGDVNWLIAEVERLREQNIELRDKKMQSKLATQELPTLRQILLGEGKSYD
jgi:hypothetical protein